MERATRSCETRGTWAGKLRAGWVIKGAPHDVAGVVVRANNVGPSIAIQIRNHPAKAMPQHKEGRKFRNNTGIPIESLTQQTHIGLVRTWVKPAFATPLHRC